MRFGTYAAEFRSASILRDGAVDDLVKKIAATASASGYILLRAPCDGVATLSGDERLSFLPANSKDAVARTFACANLAAGLFAKPYEQVRVKGGRILGRARSDQAGRALDALLSAALLDKSESLDLERNYTAGVAFQERLDLQLKTLLDEAGRVHVQTWNWLCARGDARVSGLRRQAYSLFPSMIGAHAEAVLEARARNSWGRGWRSGVGRPEPDMDAVLSAIDAGAELVPQLAVTFKTTPAVVRATQGVRFGVYLNEPFIRLVELASLLPPGCLPRAADRSAGTVFLKNPLSPAPAYGGAVGDDAPKNPSEAAWAAMGSASLEWTRLLRDWTLDGGGGPDSSRIVGRVRLESSAWTGGRSAERFVERNRASDAGDMADDFLAKMLLPVVFDHVGVDAPKELPTWSLPRAAPRGKGPSALEAALLRPDRTLSKIAAISEQWHKEERSIDAAVVSAGKIRSWPPIARSWSDPASPISVVPLTTSTELAEEGLAMDHCVGSYISACLFRGSHILSLRGADGGRMSTAELRIEDGAAAVVQHQGKGNAAPSDGCARALDSYLALLNGRELGFDPEALTAAASARTGERSKESWTDSIGYDPTDRAARNAAKAAFSFALPSAEREMDHAEWVRALGLDKIIAEAAKDFLEKEPSKRADAPGIGADAQR